jgi:GNAT superfamily N-acetyltransferase
VAEAEAVALSIVIRHGRDDEGLRLKEIAIAAKGFWGYEPEKVRAWADQGDFTPERLRQLVVFVAEEGGRAIGWSSLIPKGETAWLEDLWIDPDWIGHGIGTQLFRRTADEAVRLGARTLEWEAEPNAIGFYEKMGGAYVRDSAVSEFGRVLSVMGVALGSRPP